MIAYEIVAVPQALGQHGGSCSPSKVRMTLNCSLAFKWNRSIQLLDQLPPILGMGQCGLHPARTDFGPSVAFASHPGIGQADPRSRRAAESASR